MIFSYSEMFYGVGLFILFFSHKKTPSSLQITELRFLKEDLFKKLEIQGYLAGICFLEKKVFVQRAFYQLESLSRKQGQIFTIFIFRGFFFLFFCFAIDLFLKKFLGDSFFYARRFLFFQSFFFGSSLLYAYFFFSLFRKKIPVISLLKGKGEAQLFRDWLDAYIFGKEVEDCEFSDTLLCLHSQALYQGISTEAEQKNFLESWALKSMEEDELAFERFLDTLPFYELGLYSGVFLFSALPWLGSVL